MNLEQYLPLNVATVFKKIEAGELTTTQALEWERANEKRTTVLEKLEAMMAETKQDDTDMIKVKVSSKLPANMVFTHPDTFVTVTAKGASVPNDAWTQRKIGSAELEIAR